MQRCTLLFSAAVILVAACGGEQGPEEVVQTFISAVTSLDVATVESVVCQAHKARMREILAPLEDTTDSGETFSVDLAELVVQEQSNDGEMAVVHASGRLILLFLGYQETQEVNETHTVIKENGRWLVCDP